jgi:hypothetical protein
MLSRQSQNALVNKGVVHDHIGLRKTRERVNREQTRVARSRTC